MATYSDLIRGYTVTEHGITRWYDPGTPKPYGFRVGLDGKAFQFACEEIRDQAIEEWLNAEREADQKKSHPQPTIDQQSHCRGYFPRVYHNRDYSHCRGNFPRLLNKRAFADEVRAVLSPLALDNPGAARKALRERLAKVKREDVYKLPVDERREWTAMRIETWSFKERTTRPIQSDILTITEVFPLTDHQLMRQEIRDTIDITPPASEWRDDKVTYDLPFGMKLGRKGGTEIAVTGYYKPEGKRFQVGTKPIVVGQLSGDRFIPLPDLMDFEKALSKIMELVREHKLNPPTPPTTPASQPIQEAA